MSADVTMLLVVAGFSILIGILMDNLARLLFFNKEEPEIEKAPAAQSGIVANAASSETRRIQPHLKELVYLWEDPADGSLVVEVNGETFRTTTDLAPSQRTHLERSTERLTAWLGRPSSPASSPLAAPPLASPPLAAPPPVYRPPVSAPPPPVASLPPAVKPVKPPSAPGLQTLAAQVDEVLQEMLVSSKFSKRQVKITDGPDKGIRVIVDLKSYDGIEAVPDPEIREFLKSAVDEWRRRTASL